MTTLHYQKHLSSKAITFISGMLCFFCYVAPALAYEMHSIKEDGDASLEATANYSSSGESDPASVSLHTKVVKNGIAGVARGMAELVFVDKNNNIKFKLAQFT